MYRCSFILLLILLLSCAPLACHAESYALLIGIDEYQHSDQINGLAGASNDAKALAKTLEEVGGFPPDHVTLLTSDGDNKPTGGQILFELGELAKEVKPGDLVFILFSGHGIEQDGVTYLVPWDALAKTDSTLKFTSLSQDTIREQLSSIPARELILAFDMCRSDPRKGEKGIAADNLMGDQAKDLRIVPASNAGDQTRPQAVVTLFSCSPNERSWEWESKGRGYFSYYLEQGLRHEAADNKGVVRVSSLVSYLEKAVPSAVARQEGQDRKQIPYTNMEGTGAGDMVLAHVKPGTQKPDSTVSFITPGPAVDTFQVRFLQSLNDGKSLLKAHQWDAAQLKYAAALDLQPNSAKAVDGLGMADAALKRWDEADKLFHQAMALDPKFADPVDHLGVMAFKNHHYDDAERLVRKAIAMDPKNAEAISNLGYYDMLVKHDYTTAETHFRQAITLDPTTSDYLVGLGALYLLKGDNAQSETYLRKAMALNPRDDQAVNFLGDLYAKKGQIDLAEQFLRKAMELDPTDAQPVADLADLTYSAKHDADGAEELCRKAISLDPQNISAVVELAEIYVVQQDFTQAERYARNAMEIDPKAGDPLFVLALIAKMQGNVAGLVDNCRQAIALDNTKAPYYVLYATGLYAQGDRAGALTAAKRAIALGAHEPEQIYQILGLNP